MSTERKLLGRLAHEGRLWKQHRKLSLNLGGKGVAIMNLGKRYESRPAAGDSKTGSGSHVIVRSGGGNAASQDKHQASNSNLKTTTAPAAQGQMQKQKMQDDDDDDNK